MLAEYFAGFPTAMVCTIAVCTGKGARAASAFCLHALWHRTQSIAEAARAYRQQAVEITLTPLPELFRNWPSNSRRQGGSVHTRDLRWTHQLPVRARRAAARPIS